jgi:hypothetical protein
MASAAAAAEEPPPSLRLSWELTWRPAFEGERAVARVERLAADSATAERAAIDDLMLRVQRASDSVQDIRRLLLALPDRLPEAPAPAVTSALPVAVPSAIAGEARTPPADDTGDDVGPWGWLASGAAFALVLTLAWIGLQRRQPEPDIEATQLLPEREIGVTVTTAEATTEATAGVTWPPAHLVSAGPTTESGESAHQMADTMMAIGLNESAARSLENHIRNHPRRALSHWLRLLDLYRQSGLRAEFDQAAERLNRQYNVALAEWLEPANDEMAESLERFPHIRARLSALWPGHEAASYLQHLLDDNRDGTRFGFSRDVIEEILLLQAVLRERQAGLSMSTN